jgi:UDP-N-acetylmuramoylalanine--D-glutamate ligase
MVDGAYYQNGMIYFKGEKICPISSIKILGKHNLKNVLAAICATKITGVKNQSIELALGQFTGLPHRLELVRELNGVRYINNSMCTNPDAGLNSLAAISTPIILITGGKEKNLAIGEYIYAIVKKAKYAILIGENRNRLKTELEKMHYEQLEIADSLEKAVARAKAKAVKGDTVLFSPGFASFDSFANFIERGEVFRNVVCNLT